MKRPWDEADLIRTGDSSRCVRVRGELGGEAALRQRRGMIDVGCGKRSASVDVSPWLGARHGIRVSISAVLVRLIVHGYDVLRGEIVQHQVVAWRQTEAAPRRHDVDDASNLGPDLLGRTKG